MRKALMMAVAAAGLIVPLAAVAHGGAANGVSVEHPWVRATPGGSTITAAFMEIKSETGDKLMSAASPAAGRVEVHTHIMEGDVMKMRRVEALDIKAGDTRHLKPMGDHIMLFDLKAPLKDGDTVKMTLTFEKAGAVEVEATVEPVGATGPHGMDQQPANSGEKSGGEHQHH